jgi:hypothetical protein
MANLEIVYAFLKQWNFVLSASSTINAILLAVKQEKAKFAQLILSDFGHDSGNNHYKQTLITSNLKVWCENSLDFC